MYALVLIAVVFAIPAYTKILPLRKPVCEPTEPCQFEFHGFPIQFCRCPGDSSKCHKTRNNSINFLGVSYQFCAPTAAKMCSPGQVAWVRKGMRQFVRCLCPEPLKLRSQKWDDDQDIVEYFCEQPKICESTGRCRERVHGRRNDGSPVSNLVHICECPAPSSCEMSELSVIERGREKELGFCQPY